MVCVSDSVKYNNIILHRVPIKRLGLDEEEAEVLQRKRQKSLQKLDNLS